MVGAFPADPNLPLKFGGRGSGLALRTSKITHVDKFSKFVMESQYKRKEKKEKGKKEETEDYAFLLITEYGSATKTMPPIMLPTVDKAIL